MKIHPALGFRLVEGPAPRRDLRRSKQAGLAVGVLGEDRRGLVLVGRLDHDEAAVRIALVVEERPGEFQRAFLIEPLEEGDVRRPRVGPDLGSAWLVLANECKQHVDYSPLRKA